ncbi:unnamed protein product [Didymodactylos carnosus]|nr:unnamed protein product [Didymodactylos carnosus]CAF3577608.1 unnamed protein product [Didymodactylos carnosus]
MGIFIDSNTGNIYVADMYNHRIQLWYPGAFTGVTVAGGNGMGSNLNQLHNPTSVILDAESNVYISDMGNHRVVKWFSHTTTNVILVAGQSHGSGADELSFPSSLQFDRDGNLYVADSNNHRVQKFMINNGPSIDSNVWTYGGTTNGTRQYCIFPFIYQGNLTSSCIKTDQPPTTVTDLSTDPWCSLTSNFDQDNQWGYCDLGVTPSTLSDICSGKSQQLKCPSGYVIDIVTAVYGVKDTLTTNCSYDPGDCFQNDDSTTIVVCAGKNSCLVYYFDKTLTLCHNRKSTYLHLNYTCVPNTVPDIREYNICYDLFIQPTNEEPVKRGYIVSPNSSNSSSNMNCSLTIQPLDKQDVYVYLLDMQLTMPLLGQICEKDKFMLIYDNATNEICGRSHTKFLFKTCSTLILQLIISSYSNGKGIKLYFEFIDRPSGTIHSTVPTAISTEKSPLLTTPSANPDYYPNISLIQTGTSQLTYGSLMTST